MHRSHRSDFTVGRPVWPVRVGHTGYTRILDGVSRCGELLDLTDCTARAVRKVPLNQQQFSFPQCHVIYKLSGVAAGTLRTHRSWGLENTKWLRTRRSCRSSRYSGHERRVRCICYYETRPFLLLAHKRPSPLFYTYPLLPTSPSLPFSLAP